MAEAIFAGREFSRDDAGRWLLSVSAPVYAAERRVGMAEGRALRQVRSDPRMFSRVFHM